MGSAWMYENTITGDMADDLGVPYGRINYFNDWDYQGLYTDFSAEELEKMVKDTGIIELEQKELK